MGKGSRNRQFHQQDMVDNPQRYKEQKRRKPMPKWATTAICIVLLLGILFGIGAYIFTKYGIIERNRVLIESKTGEFDITQPTATYIAWQNTYYQAMMEYEYMRLGYLKDEQGVTKVGGANYVEREQYGLVVAQLYLKDYLRDAIDGIAQIILEIELSHHKTVLLALNVVGASHLGYTLLILQVTQAHILIFHHRLVVGVLPCDIGGGGLSDIKLTGFTFDQNAVALNDSVFCEDISANAKQNAQQKHDADCGGCPLRHRFSSFLLLVSLRIIHHILLMELSVSASFSHKGFFPFRKCIWCMKYTL